MNKRVDWMLLKSWEDREKNLVSLFKKTVEKAKTTRYWRAELKGVDTGTIKNYSDVLSVLSRIPESNADTVIQNHFSGALHATGSMGGRCLMSSGATRQKTFDMSWHDNERMVDAAIEWFDAIHFNEFVRMTTIVMPIGTAISGWCATIAMDRIESPYISPPYGPGVPIGMVGSILSETKSNVFFTYPSMVHRLGKFMEEKHIPHNVKFALVGGEFCSENRTKLIEDIWGLDGMIQCYGATEFRGVGAYQCFDPKTKEKSLSYHVCADTIIRVMDPKSGEPVSEGEWGAVLVTPLDYDRDILFNFRIGDAAKYEGRTKCSICGQDGIMIGDIQREEDIFSVGKEPTEFSIVAAKVKLMDIEDELNKPEYTPQLSRSREYTIILAPHSGKEILNVLVDSNKGFPEAQYSGLASEIRKGLREQHHIKIALPESLDVGDVVVHVYPEGTIETIYGLMNQGRVPPQFDSILESTYTEFGKERVQGLLPLKPGKPKRLIDLKSALYK